MQKKGMLWYCVAVALSCIAILELINTAWISDDAAITLRSALNFINGYGPNFNISERVQSYTHPLWFLIISGASIISNNILTATYGTSIFISFLVILILVTRTSPNLWGGIKAVTLLILSKAYVDFSTSGLENPLSHLLILISVLSGLSFIKNNNKNAAKLSLVCGAMLYLSRPDLILLILPWCSLIIYRAYKTKNDVLSLLIIAALPILLWTIFSIVYYGFPFPNTAYSKLNTALSIFDRSLSGLRYILDSLIHDPITMCAIVIALFLGVGGSSEVKMLSLGISLYLLYIIAIGGDFMSGRLLTPLYFTAIIMLVFFNMLKKYTFWVLVLLGGINVNSTILSGSSYAGDGNWGIADERGFYYQKYGLLPIIKRKEMSIIADWNSHYKIEKVSIVSGGLGFGSLAEGPAVHVIDVYALSDPLLSRLPPIKKSFWRVGHLTRQPPINYAESIIDNTNHLKDADLHNYYDQIRKITRGDLFTFDRFKAIYSLNFTAPPKFDVYATLSGDLTPAHIVTADHIAANDIHLDEPILGVVEISLPKSKTIYSIDAFFDDGNSYKIEYLEKNQFKILMYLPKPKESSQLSNRYAIFGNYGENIKRIIDFFGIGRRNSKELIHYSLPTATNGITTDRFRITAIDGDGKYILGHMQFK